MNTKVVLLGEKEIARKKARALYPVDKDGLDQGKILGHRKVMRGPVAKIVMNLQNLCYI